VTTIDGTLPQRLPNKPVRTRNVYSRILANANKFRKLLRLKISDKSLILPVTSDVASPAKDPASSSPFPLT
jgi:hypothetical protein